MVAAQKGAIRLAPVFLAIFLAAVLVPTTEACSLDGIASLSVNGHVASLTTDRAIASTLAYWSSFHLLAAAPDDDLRYAENLANVSLSIPKASVVLPFKWSFGDGQTVLGRTVTHRYRQTGWYRLTVHYYWPARRQWVQFDSAEQQIVPPSALLWTNFSFYAGNVFVIALRVIIWSALAVVIALLILERLRPGLRRRLLRRRGPSRY